MNQHARQVKVSAESMSNYPYAMGGWGGEKNTPPFGIDCRGFVQMAYKAAGARGLIGDYQPNVRAMYKWAKDNGRLRGPEIVPGRMWLVIYAENTTKAEPGNPLHIRHVGLLWRPVSAKHPKGLVMSAVNPKWDVQLHELLIEDLGIRNLKVLAYVEPDWAALDVPEPAMVDPEPTLP